MCDVLARHNGEEINGDELSDMIFEECAPRLRGRSVAAQHVFADAALSDVDPEFEQFSMDPGCTPKGILPAHLVDENSDCTRNDRSCVKCFCFTSCSTFSRSRSRWFKAIHSVSMAPRHP
jgi:hypothetical protein